MSQRNPAAAPLLERVGHNVRSVRLDRGLTQAAFAALVGRSQTVVSRIERGTYDSLSLEDVVELCLALELELGELLDGAELALELARARGMVGASA